MATDAGPTLTESDHCPLAGDRPDPAHRGRHDYRASPHDILIPGRVLPGDTTDAAAEHERAMYGAREWSRAVRDGNNVVILWVER